MKIAIYHNLPSGGGKRALYEMVRRLAIRHRIDVFSLSTADHEFCDLSSFCENHRVYDFKPLTLARRPFGRLNQGIRAADLFRLKSLQQQIAHEIDHTNYDVAFIHNCQFSQSPSLLQYLNTPSIYYCGEPPRRLYEPVIERPYKTISRAQRFGNLFDPFPGIYWRSLRGIDQSNVRAASVVLVNSHYSRETFYRTYGIFANVNRLGVDTEKFRPLEVERKNQVLSVGALNPYKGFDFLIASIALIDFEVRPKLIIVCNQIEAREQSYLLELAGDVRVKLEIRANVSDEELVEIYNQSLMTMYAPIMEPFGFVPLESMACNTPVIGVREAGIRETILHSKTGLLVERDLRTFSKATTNLINDESKRNSLGRAGRDYVKTSWSWEESVNQVQNNLLDLVSRKT